MKKEKRALKRKWIFLWIFALILFFSVRPIVVEGHSMSPAVKNGDSLIMEMLSLHLCGIERGDIVIFELPFHNEDGSKQRRFIKRVVGISGDHITIEKGKVHIDGEGLKENALKNIYTSGTYDFDVPKGCVFVMGDNRTQSYDSRQFEIGPVEEKWILGRAFFRIWPLYDLGWIH